MHAPTATAMVTKSPVSESPPASCGCCAGRGSSSREREREGEAW